MPTVDERLRHVTLKLERAKEHVGDLNRELRAFLDTKPYGVACKTDPKTRKPVYYVSCVHPIPESIPLIAGDGIQNLMSALDHLAYQIVCSDTMDNPPNPNWIYFPIADDAAKYEAKKRGKIEGAAQESFDAIDALKPYKGGNDLLWILYRLNNIEKHRLLLTVGSQAEGIHLGQLMATVVRSLPDDFAKRSGMLPGLESLSAFLVPDDKGFPLKEGFELYIGAPDEKPNPKQQFRFTVALNEPGIVEGKPLIETLHQLTTLVEGIVTALKPRLIASS